MDLCVHIRILIWGDMMKNENVKHENENHGQDVHAALELKIGLKKYIIGFILCIILTALSYVGATGLVADRFTIVVLLSVFASAQVLVQLIYFMHVGDEAKPRYVLMNLVFFVIVLAIITFGSIWIMYALQYTH